MKELLDKLKTKNYADRMSRADLMWVVGLLEGEGSFSSYIPKRSSKPTRHIQCCSTDQDVMEKLAQLTGGKCHGPYRNGSNSAPHHKVYWKFGIYKTELIFGLGEAILPHMGERRQGQIRKMLEQ